MKKLLLTAAITALALAGLASTAMATTAEVDPAGNFTPAPAKSYSMREVKRSTAA
jgi:hypothetical protein